MRFDPFDLQKVLNYDTNFKKVFNAHERVEIHTAISYKFTYLVDLDLPPTLAGKVKGVLYKIKETNWQIVTAIYYVDKVDGQMKIKTI